MISACTLIAFRRNELNLFWSGNFYDEILLDPFKNEMDKKSVKLISFFNIGVSQDLKKKYALNSGTEQPAAVYEPFELVKANQDGELKLDSILFEGLQSFQEIYTTHNQTYGNNNTLVENQKQQQEIQTDLKEKKDTALVDSIIQNSQENQPLINRDKNDAKVEYQQQDQQNNNDLNQKGKNEEATKINNESNTSPDVLKQKSLGKKIVVYIESKKLEEVIIETPIIQSRNNEKQSQNNEPNKKQQQSDIQIEISEQQKVAQANQNKQNNQQDKVDKAEQKQNQQQQNNKVFTSPARQKYQVDPPKAKEPQVDRFKQKQQLRQQNDNFKKNLEFFQNQEKAGNFKAPVKK